MIKTHPAQQNRSTLFRLIEKAQDERTPEQLKEHYEIEKELANILRSSSTEKRKELYSAVYDEFNRRIPFHAELYQKQAQKTALTGSPEWRFLRRFLRKETIFLEIGAGICTTSLAAAGLVKKVYALEVSAEIIKNVRGPENFETSLFDGFSIPTLPERPNVAYSDQVMEHIHPDDAINQLRSIYKALSPGGMYICITPNRLNGPHDISKHFDLVATGFHLKEYTNTELSQRFRQVGFSKVRVYFGMSGHYLRWPLFCIKLQEGLFHCLPPRLSRAAARLSLPWCIRLVGVKE